MWTVSAIGCRYYEQASLPASYNWSFRHTYPEADRLINAFDFGHAILYEELARHPLEAADRVERQRFHFIVAHLLPDPPGEPLDEEALAPDYVRLIPEAHEMFAWAHMLHRAIYDIWADDHIPPDRKDAEVARAIRYYRTRGDLALSSRPKRMSLMTDGPFGGGFRKACPRYSGLLWSYHWLQMVLYDAMIDSDTPAARRADIAAAVKRFGQLIADPPAHMPTVMPMSASIAPEFARRYPDAAIIFDNLHSFHDVVADIMIATSIPARAKRNAVLTAAAVYRDSTSDVTSVADWRAMATMTSPDQMGGIGFLPGPR